MNRAVTYGLIGVGVVAVVGAVAYVASRPSSSDTPQFSNPPPGGNVPTGNVDAEIVRGSANLLTQVAGDIARQIGRDRDIAARERERQNDREHQDLVDMGKLER